jgi:general secretion pathway protein H
MRISPTANNAQKLRGDAGVTLVEALVAIAVVAMMAGMVLLSAPGPERVMRNHAERFAAFVARGAEESVTTNRPVALVLTREGYGFARREASGWAPITYGSPLAFRPWPEGVSFTVEEGLAIAETQGRVAAFDVLGGATPAQILLSRAGQTWRVTLTGEGNVDVAQAQ